MCKLNKPSYRVQCTYKSQRSHQHGPPERAPTTYIGLLRIKPFAEINRAVRMGGRLAWISSGSPSALHTFRGPASPNPKLEFTIHDPTWIEDGDETGHLHTGFCVVCKVGFYVEVNVVTTLPLVIMWQAIKQKENARRNLDFSLFFLMFLQRWVLRFWWIFSYLSICKKKIVY